MMRSFISRQPTARRMPPVLKHDAGSSFFEFTALPFQPLRPMRSSLLIFCGLLSLCLDASGHSGTGEGRRVRREFTWTNSAWQATGEVRYVYDGGDWFRFDEAAMRADVYEQTAKQVIPHLDKAAEWFG